MFKPKIEATTSPTTMASSVDLIGDLAIVQGKTYNKIALRFPGDLTTWTPRAQIRKRWVYKEPDAEPIAEFTFGAALYDAETNKTLFVPTLSAETTAALKPTRYQGTGDPDTSTAYVWDLELSNGESVTGLDWGFVQIKPEVTA